MLKLNQRNQFLLPENTRYWLLFLGVLALYALLIIPALTRLGFHGMKKSIYASHELT